MSDYIDALNKITTIQTSGVVKSLEQIGKLTDLVPKISFPDFSKNFSLLTESMSRINTISFENISSLVDLVGIRTSEILESINFNTCFTIMETLQKNMFSVINSLNINNVLSGTIFETDIEQVDKESSEKVVTDSVEVVKKVVEDKTITNLEKRNWISNFWRFLQIIEKIFGSGMMSIILFAAAPLWQDFYDDTIKPAIYYQEFYQIQQESPELDLRIIVRNTPLYKGKKMKSIVTWLEEYEIVEVIDASQGDKIKVRIYDSEYEGWIYKKYSKTNE